MTSWEQLEAEWLEPPDEDSDICNCGNILGPYGQCSYCRDIDWQIELHKEEMYEGD